MTLRVVATGIVLRLGAEPALDAGRIAVEATCFAEIDREGEVDRVERRTSFSELPNDGDPTTALLAAAREQQELNLGALLGDLRRAGVDVTRFEFFSAPFRLDLSDELAARLRGLWAERPPRGGR